MNFKTWRKNRNTITKLIFIDLIISFILSFLHLLIFTIAPSIIKDKLICATFAHGGGCGGILGFLIFFFLTLFFGFIYSLIPGTVISLIIGLLLNMTKRKK